MEPATAGDPTSDVKWTRKSTRRIAKVLTDRRTPISHSSVHRKLKSGGYSLRSNRKRLSIRQSPDRDRQFKKINKLKRKYLRRGLPVISVDAKKRELVGSFKNPGRVWRRTFRDVNTYDFPSDADGVAIPYGIYDVGHEDGFVVVGTSRNTPAFAVNAIRWWWRTYGRRRYPDAPELLILADSGGSNGANAHEWKVELERFAKSYGIRIRVAHYPTGASKWNPVEHKIFGPISINWAGEPLVDHETICGFIGNTRTTSGAKCRVFLDMNYWPTQKERAAARKVPVGKKRRLAVVHRDPILPHLNYTVNQPVASKTVNLL